MNAPEIISRTGGDPRRAASPELVCQARVEALVALFERIQWQRMADVPVLNHRLRVRAVGFAPVVRPADAAKNEVHGAKNDEHAALGILITPWFMNLVWLPLQRIDLVPPPDQRRERLVSGAVVEFALAHEPAIGAFETCSLFSPMFDFGSQAAAVATACHVLSELRASGAAAANLVAPAATAPRAAVEACAVAQPCATAEPRAQAGARPARASAAQSARRAFFFGRSAPAP